MDMDNAELKDLRELKAIKEEYGWTNESREYKLRLKAIQKKYSKLAKAESKPKGGNVKVPGQPMKKMVWGAKGGFKEVTTDAEEWDDAFDLLNKKIHKGEWDVDRSAPGNNTNRRFLIKPTKDGEKPVAYARMIKTEDGTITIQKGEPAPVKEAQVKPEPVPEAAGDDDDDDEDDDDDDEEPAVAPQPDPPPSTGRPKRTSKPSEKKVDAAPAEPAKKKPKKTYTA